MRAETGAESLARAAVAQRAARVAAGTAPGGSPVVIKVISSRRSRARVKELVRYVARLEDAAPVPGDAELGTEDGDRVEEQPPAGELAGSGDKPVVRDEWGAVVPRHAIMDRIDGWGLLSDRDNLTRQARDLLAQADEIGRDAALRLIADLPSRKRLAHVQAVHLELSLPLGHEPPAGSRPPPDPDRERQVAALGVVADAVVKETFGAWGHKVLWAMHREPSRVPHVHLVVRALTDDGRRLRFARDGALLDGLRATLARHARALGLAVTEARIADRPELAERLVAGAAEPDEVRGLVRRRTPLLTRLELSAARWFRDHGAGVASRLASFVRGAPQPAPVRGDGPSAQPVPPAGPGAAQKGPLERALLARQVYRDAIETLTALRRFEAMQGENAAFAHWVLPRHPAVFGEPGPGAAQLAADGSFRRLLRSLRQVTPQAAPAVAQAPRASASPVERQLALLRLSEARETLARQADRLPGTDPARAATAAALREQAVELRRRAAGIAGAPALPERPEPARPPAAAPTRRGPRAADRGGR